MPAKNQPGAAFYLACAVILSLSEAQATLVSPQSVQVGPAPSTLVSGNNLNAIFDPQSQQLLL